MSAGAPSSDETADPVRCADWVTIRSTRIEGDFVALAGEACALRRTVVTGDVYIEPDGHLALYSSLVMGDVHIVPEGTMHSSRSTIWGGVHLDETGSVRIYETTVFRSIRGSVAGGLNLRGATIRGAFNVTSERPGADGLVGRMWVDDTKIEGWVNTHGGDVRISRSTLHRGLTLSAAERVILCTSSVSDDVTVRWAHGLSALGQPTDLTWWNCNPEERDVPPGNELHGSVLLVDNPHSIRVQETMIAGDLICTGNTGPRGVDTQHPSVVVHGARTGQCA